MNSTESQKVHFLAPNVSPSGTVLTFELTVTDSNGQSNSSEVVVAVQDCSSPVITGLGNQTTPVSYQTWTWSATKPATYRYAIDQRQAWTPTGDFSNVTSAGVSDGTGTWYLHVQAKDDLGYLSEVVTVYTIMQEAQTNSSLTLRFTDDTDAKPWYDPDDNLSLYASYTNEEGISLDIASLSGLGVQTNWQSTDAGVATVKDGLVSFHETGRVRIIATAGGMSAEYEFQVGQPGEAAQTKTYGNLIILAGGDPTDTNDELAPAIQYLSQRMYRIFSARGFHDEDIYFINHQTVDLDGDGMTDGIVDEQEKTVANLEQAITWRTPRQIRVRCMFISLLCETKPKKNKEESHEKNNRMLISFVNSYVPGFLFRRRSWES